jgi:hypothetical protein
VDVAHLRGGGARCQLAEPQVPFAPKTPCAARKSNALPGAVVEGAKEGRQGKWRINGSGRHGQSAIVCVSVQNCLPSLRQEDVL